MTCDLDLSVTNRAVTHITICGSLSTTDLKIGANLPRISKVQSHTGAGYIKITQKLKITQILILLLKRFNKTHLPRTWLRFVLDLFEEFPL